MKTITRTLAILLSCLFGLTAQSQNALQFTGVRATVENAIILSWASNSNEVYQVDYTDQLAGNEDGSTTWQSLYTDYPSHGTNTFIADAGNYDTIPEILHPKRRPMRFYRVSMIGTNTSPTNPTISISSPTNGASLSGEVNVVVSWSTPEILSEVQLYIDGEEQRITADRTNFVINTCEWPNGPHTLFAIAKSQSALEGFPFGFTTTFGRAVSAYKTVTFDNLITRVDLSEPFFEPSEGQTQRVSAVFAANVDWVLEIQDVNSNDVIYTTGSGTSMEYYWDGNDTNGSPIPDGVYSYLITAQTNGGSFAASFGGGESANFASSSESENEMEWLAMPSDGSGAPVPLVLYPPGVDTNDLTIFQGYMSDYQPMRSSAVAESYSMESAESAAASNAPSAQATRAPKRKPRIGVKGKAGTFGVCYQSTPKGFFAQQPRTGANPPLQAFVAIDSFPASSSLRQFGSQKLAATDVKGFQQGMQIGGWKAKFVLGDEQWNGDFIRKSSLGGSNILNTCDFGLLSTHGCFGTSTEIDGVKYTYLTLFSIKYGPEQVRFNDLNLGSNAPGGLKWMTVLSCNTLHPANVTSMRNNSKFPANDDLHLLMGATTYTYDVPFFGITYASNLVVAGETIKNAFINAGRDSYADAYNFFTNSPATMTNTTTFRVMGSQPCMSDTVLNYNDPDPDAQYQISDTTIFTHP